MKQGRNQTCNCGSGIKFKKCCLNKKEQQQQHKRERIIYGDEYCTQEIETIAKQLKVEFPDHEVIDVSSVADTTTYKPLQLQHYNKKVIMLMQKNEFNEDIFVERVPAFIDKLVLYRGAYTAVEDPDNLEIVCDMISTRLNNQEWNA